MKDPAARFWSKVDKTGAKGTYTFEGAPCWLWTAAVFGEDKFGARYGSFWFDGRNVLAHRWAYEQEVGPVAFTLDHRCRQRQCVNPAHLEDVTAGENVLRGNSPPSRAKRTGLCIKGHLREGHTYTDRRGFSRCVVCSREHAKEAWRRKHPGRPRRTA